MSNNRQKYVCSECTGSNELKQDIFSTEKERKTCNYCGKRRFCISLGPLADAVDNIYRSDYEPCESGDSPLEIISAEILELDNSAGMLELDLVSILSDRESGSEYKDTEPMYDEGMTYRPRCEKYAPLNDGREHKELWDFFCKRIKHRTRFFNTEMVGWLNNIFSDIDKFSYENGEKPIRTIQPTESDAVFFRARHAANPEERIKICCHPAQELSSPPVHFAANGRMNPIGISVFYAAFERETCIAEIRLPVGATAISGQFKLEKPITIFDLTLLDKIDSQESISQSLDHDVDPFEDRLAFLRMFSAEISKPISPNKEALDYMPTQALVEYLAHHYKPNIDAVVYASTQTNGKGKNIVFLNQTAKVAGSQHFKSGTYKAMWGENFYYVAPDREVRRFIIEPVQWDEFAEITFYENFDADEDKFLSFVPGSLKVHKVLAINYDVQCFSVDTMECADRA
jgi:hypothetical protein